jgi:hypothetical protein
MVVHHKDRNDYNNAPDNLMVFACNGDHIRYHHLMRHLFANPISNPRQKAWDRYHPDACDVPILWDGSTVKNR